MLILLLLIIGFMANFVAALNVIFQFSIYSDSFYSKNKVEELKVIKNLDLFVPAVILVKKFYPSIAEWLAKEAKKPKL